MNLKNTYNKIGDDWFKDHKPDDWWHQGTDIFISFLKSGAKVLDAGCGGGIASQYLIERGFSVTGIDFSEKMIEIAKREAPLGKFLVMDMRDIGSLAEQFDGVYGKASLLHFPKKDIPEIIGGLVKTLKNGGFLYVAVKETKPGQKDEQVITENDYGHEYQRFFSFFSLPEMEKYFTDSGIKVRSKRVFQSGSTSWIEVIGQKV